MMADTVKEEEEGRKIGNEQFYELLNIAASN